MIHISMIVMLGHLELDIKVSDIGMKSMKSNDCRGLSRDNRNANSMLATV